MEFHVKNTKNPHLKIILEEDINILKKLINESLKYTDTVSILNIGGGISKVNEKFLKGHKKTDYYILDLHNNECMKNVFIGDITDENLVLEKKFDLIYTSDTFEHILNPWEATKNIKKLLKNKGFLFCKVPFSWRYHACPFDTYRYSHTGIRYIFEHLSQIRPIMTGYKKLPSNKGWWADKTDETLNGKNFNECIETYYVGQKEENYLFDISSYDKKLNNIY